MRPRGTLTGLIAGLAVVVAVSGCTRFWNDDVCPAVGYVHELVVRADAASVEVITPAGGGVLCSETGCSDAPPAPLVGPDLQDPAGGGEHRWMLVDTPPEVVVQLTAADGSTTQAGHSLEWTRVGGSERCGGPHEAVLDLRSGRRD
ncbi:hypothetical protein [Aeromicrobium alkaliterrae]|uniref:Lipoprotein n=1 Tax=Aeromicrobium alkaliterrae TaxID=302168 RepID=A0ABN2JTY4_9ACTN